MHGGMQNDPIQGQCQGHEPLKVGNTAIFNAISSPVTLVHWELATNQ